ncbi:uncharacterized protein METZ01_LOCUS311724, partial [marine metagenome]
WLWVMELRNFLKQRSLLQKIFVSTF